MGYICSLRMFYHCGFFVTAKGHDINGFFRFLKRVVGIISGPLEGKDYKWYISGIFPANWGIICYLPPFRGTRNNH